MRERGAWGRATELPELFAGPGRFRRRVRWLLVRGLSAVVAGVLVLGLGGRLVMLLSRLLHPDAIGRLTEGGNRIGDVTLEGTLGLVLFVGVFSGLAAGVIWALVAMWLPRRWWTVGLATTALGGRGVIDAGNRDFVVLDPPGLDVALFLLLLFAFGVALLAIDGWIARRLAAEAGDLGTAAQAVLVLLATSFVIPAFGLYFSTDFCFCDDPPRWVGAGLVVAAGASIWTWVVELRAASRVPTWLPLVGRAGVGLAALAGAVELAGQVRVIV